MAGSKYQTLREYTERLTLVYELTGLSRNSRGNLNVFNLSSDFVSRLRPGYHLDHQYSRSPCDHIAAYVWRNEASLSPISYWQKADDYKMLPEMAHSLWLDMSGKYALLSCIRALHLAQHHPPLSCYLSLGLKWRNSLRLCRLGHHCRQNRDESRMTQRARKAWGQALL